MVINGIDISSNNPHYASIDTSGLTFCVVKLTEGTGYTNPLARDQAVWARARGLTVGYYHWVKPFADPHAQAAWFVAQVHAHGAWAFWALDIEDNNPPATPITWDRVAGVVWGDVEAALGNHGSAYMGRYFPGPALTWVQARNWWLPDYRKNPILTGGVVIHQRTSTGGPGGSPLDCNHVVDEVKFRAMCTGLGNDKNTTGKVDGMFLMHAKSGAGFLVTDKGKSSVATGADYAAMRDKGGVRDAGQMDDATIAAVSDAE